MLTIFFGTDRKIPLDSIDVFWRKLDMKPAKTNDEDVDLDAELDVMKQNLMSQPPQVKKSMLSKIKSVFNPLKSNKKPPVVQQNTRGRPTSKVQEQRKDDAQRHSSFAPSDQSGCDPARHSSYIPSQGSPTPSTATSSQKPAMRRSLSTATSSQKPAKPAMRHSHSTTSKQQNHPRYDHGFPRIEGDKSLNDIIRYKLHIPELFHAYVSRIKDVKPDGHCGFRSACVGLGLEQNNYSYIRQQLLEELTVNKEVWAYIFNTELPGEYDRVYNRINYSGVGFAPPEHWMEFPNAGLLLAQKFGVIVHLLSAKGSETFFPLTYGPYVLPQPHQVITIVFVNGNHFIHVKLDGEYPMPLPNHVWMRNRSEDASLWYELYEHRIQSFIHIMNPNPDYNVHDIG